MKRLVPLFLALVPLALPLSLSAEEPLRVGVSILPHQYMVERIGGDRVQVIPLVAPGQNPHTFDPTPKQVGELAKCALFFGVDMPFEAQVLERLKGVAPNLKVVDLQDGITLRRFTDDEQEAHSHEGEADDHGHGHDHGHDHKPQAPAAKKETHDHAHDHGHADNGENDATDPHTWMNPRFALIQAKSISTALAAADPAGAELYQENYAKLAQDLEALDKELTESLAPLKGKELLVYHPAFGYFADAYGMKQVAVETGGREPNAKQLRALIKRAKASGARVVFVQPQFAKKSAQAVAEQIGGTVVALDDLGADYLANLKEVAARVRENVGAQ